MPSKTLPTLRIGDQELYLTNPAVDPTDLWRNLFSLRVMVDALMARVVSLEYEVNRLAVHARVCQNTSKEG